MDVAAGLAEKALREVKDRHLFFADWLTGRLAETALADSMRGFLPNFRRIAPDGSEMDRATLETWLAAHRGTMPKSFTIEIADLRIVLDTSACIAVGYREIQPGQTPPSHISTALFVPEEVAPNGVAWLHVQETWDTQSGD
ncbi:MAG: hypothetical protein EPN45_23465 [Rhizobiaceae bacterium]|nr:MAG: hypothetical protein EPN45_23465 [Rhizobiaceae bacterium]